MIMTTEQIFEIINAIVKVAGILFAVYIAPNLKEILVTVAKYVNESKFLKFVLQMVQWANQTIPAEEWERKKKEVYDRVLEYVAQHNGLDFTEEQIDAIIEAFVIEVKENNKKKVTKK